uniref:RING-type domain-containing protein n=1 Tax=Eimeria tenella TaxID=5802 RepID=H9BA64_EIMTE|nr:hypothetical protein [Eimeria tenella]
MVLSGATLNDAILLFAFLYSSSDVFVEWEAFDTCSKPVHLWLLGSYVALVAFRLSHYLGQYLSNDGEEFMLHRQRGPPFWVSVLILGILFPCFFGWTIVGTVWFLEIQEETPYCLPRESHPWFFTFWLALCYIWILIYIIFIATAVVCEYRARRMERDLQILQNEDMIRRWGRIRIFSDYGIYIFRRGLTPDQVARIPWQKLEYDPTEMMPCSICLEEFAAGDNVRILQACGHIFHKCCIDIWLLRNAVCPNCKSPILAGPSNGCNEPSEVVGTRSATCSTAPSPSPAESVASGDQV